ncbi:hypothetical protein ACPPVQ_13700 [Diaminobutyricibacter sp. McL0618]|uniref:hypothetical protein n=1 Tax=Leifsonia sp. McL0618 TaxID=3415677 RepID=UPI003CF5CDEE
MAAGTEYIIVNIHGIPGRSYADVLTVEINRVAQHGWKLVGTPFLLPETSPGKLPATFLATFERMTQWESPA